MLSTSEPFEFFLKIGQTCTRPLSSFNKSNFASVASEIVNQFFSGGISMSKETIFLEEMYNEAEKIKNP